MSLKQSSNNDIGATIGGALRAAAFLALVVALTPVQLAALCNKSANPRRLPLIFHKLLVRVLGIRVRTHGTMETGFPTLYVVNHTSYLDIPILGSTIPSAFVSKAEVADWPFFGVLAKLQQTVFIERRASRVGEQSNNLRDRLQKGQSLILFPEGTSSIGLTALPFKSSFFSTVEGDLAVPVRVQPVSVACSELDGLPMTRALRPMFAWYGDMTLMGHLWNVFKYGRFTIDIVFHPPVDPKAFADRKVLASYCQQQVAHGIEQFHSGRGISTADKPALPAPSGKLIGA